MRAEDPGRNRKSAEDHYAVTRICSIECPSLLRKVSLWQKRICELHIRTKILSAEEEPEPSLSDEREEV